MEYCVSLTNGRELQIDEATFKKIDKRILNGRLRGFYTMPSGPTQGTSVNLEHVASVEIKMTDKERKALEAKKEAERKARLAQIANAEDTSLNNQKTVKGEFEFDPKTCPINHRAVGDARATEVDVRFTMSDTGVKRYFPVCNKCGWRGTLVKPASLMNTYGIEADEVLPYEDGS